MPLIDRIAQDMVAAMKSREEARLSALRLIKAALMKLKVDSPQPLDEAAEMQVLKQLIKQRIDAAIAEALAETGAASLKQMGLAMKAAQARLRGKTVDGKALSDKVRSKLS